MMNIIGPILRVFTSALNLTNHFLRTTSRLPGSISGSILNSVATVVLTPLPILCRVTELPAQAFRSIIQASPENLLWCSTGLTLWSLLRSGFFFYLLNTGSPPITHLLGTSH